MGSIFNWNPYLALEKKLFNKYFLLYTLFETNSTQMKLKKIIYFSAFLFLAIISNFSCGNKGDLYDPYSNIGGYVIGKENCHINASQDYWLLDFTVHPNSPQIGDTINLNGITYTNVLKVKGLDERLKQLGMRVSIDYNTITPNKVITSECSIPNPDVYPLKELFIIHQFEIR